MKTFLIESFLFIIIITTSFIITNREKLMAATNDITGDQIKSKFSTEKYRNNYDLIFNKPKETPDDKITPTNPNPPTSK